MFDRIRNSFIRIVKIVKQKITKFIYDCFDHTEAVVILVLASFGANTILARTSVVSKLSGSLFEEMMIVPVLAVLIVVALVKIAELRAAMNEGIWNEFEIAK